MQLGLILITAQLLSAEHVAIAYIKTRLCLCEISKNFSELDPDYGSFLFIVWQGIYVFSTDILLLVLTSSVMFGEQKHLQQHGAKLTANTRQQQSY